MPRPLIVASVIALVLLILSLLRVRVSVCLKQDFSYRVTLLGIPILQYPKKVWWRIFSPRVARLYERWCDRKFQKKMAKKATRRIVRRGDGNTLSDKAYPYLEQLRLIRAQLAVLLRKTRKHVKLRVARLHVRVATGDAAATALLYGTVMAILSPLFSLLSRITRLRAKEPDVAVIPDFLGDRSDVDVRLELSITLPRLIALLGALTLSYWVAVKPREFFGILKYRFKHARKGAAPAPDDK